MKCCPLCKSPVPEIKGLAFVAEMGYWNGKPLGLTLKASRVFRLLYDRLGELVRSSSIHNDLYGLRSDGGPDSRVIQVYVCAIRKRIKTEKMPFVLTTHWNYDDSGGYALNFSPEKGFVND